MKLVTKIQENQKKEIKITETQVIEIPIAPDTQPQRRLDVPKDPDDDWENDNMKL